MHVHRTSAPHWNGWKSVFPRASNQNQAKTKKCTARSTKVGKRHVAKRKSNSNKTLFILDALKSLISLLFCSSKRNKLTFIYYCCDSPYISNMKCNINSSVLLVEYFFFFSLSQKRFVIWTVSSSLWHAYKCFHCFIFKCFTARYVERATLSSYPAFVNKNKNKEFSPLFLLQLYPSNVFQQKQQCNSFFVCFFVCF